MNQKEFEKFAIEMLVELAVDMGEPFPIYDHDDLKDYFDGNVSQEEFDEIVELIPNVDIEEFNDKVIPAMDEGIVNMRVLRAEYR